MNMLKKLSILFLVLIKTAGASEINLSGDYGLHLFFNEKEFVDVMSIETNEKGEITGEMFVPDDFDGKLLNIKHDGLKLTFDLFVPKNRARAVDLIFHYKLQFHAQDAKEFIGFVTLKDETDFVASFVGFKR